MSQIDTKFSYTGFHGCASFCRLRVFKRDAGAVVVMTETGDNSGTSVTNAVEEVATQACERYSLNPHNTIFIEHYPDSREPSRDGHRRPDAIFEEHFDRVTFASIAREGVNWSLAVPQWKRMAREQVERLTGKVWETEYERA
jgi:hypothetical protein